MSIRHGTTTIRGFPGNIRSCFPGLNASRYSSIFNTIWFINKKDLKYHLGLLQIPVHFYK